MTLVWKRPVTRRNVSQCPYRSVPKSQFMSAVDDENRVELEVKGIWRAGKWLDLYKDVHSACQASATLSTQSRIILIIRRTALYGTEELYDTVR